MGHDEEAAAQLGRAIRAVRAMWGWTTDEAATEAEAGVNRMAWERAETAAVAGVRSTSLRKIAHVLGLDKEALVEALTRPVDLEPVDLEPVIETLSANVEPIARKRVTPGLASVRQCAGRRGW